MEGRPEMVLADFFFTQVFPGLDNDFHVVKFLGQSDTLGVESQTNIVDQGYSVTQGYIYQLFAGVILAFVEGAAVFADVFERRESRVFCLWKWKNEIRVEGILSQDME